METKEYFEKVMQDFNQHRNGRSLRKYCQDEGIDYKWLQEYKRTYPNESKPVQKSEPGPQSFIPLVIEEENTLPKSVWQVSHLRLESPDGGFIDINSNSLAKSRRPSWRVIRLCPASAVSTSSRSLPIT